MDALIIILRAVRESIQASGVPPDALQDALTQAERRCRAMLGGGLHPISRMPPESLKSRIIGHAQAGRAVAEIVAITGADESYVHRVLATGGVERITRRVRIIELAAEGLPQEQIAAKLSSSQEYVGKVLRKLRTG